MKIDTVDSFDLINDSINLELVKEIVSDERELREKEMQVRRGGEDGAGGGTRGGVSVREGGWTDIWRAG